MGNSKTKYNTYVRESFEGKCASGSHHHHPGHPKAGADGCMKNADMNAETFGAFSLKSSIRGGTGRNCCPYVGVPGVN